MADSTMGWQAMGKPDFSQCAKFFYRLPADLRNSLNRSEEKVLIWTLFLSWTTSFHAGRQGTITSFSETWVGNKFGRSRWTVARALQKLEECSLLKRIRRKPKKDGTYRTNLIALTAKLSGFLSGKSFQVPEKSPCSKPAPQELESDYKREKAAPLKAPPLLSQAEKEELWKEEPALTVEQARARFSKLLWTPKPSVTGA